MLTFKLKILNLEDEDFVLQKQKNYSYAFRKLFSFQNKIDDKIFLKSLKNKYSLQDYEMNCLVIDVKTKISQIQTNKTQNEEKQIEISKLLEKGNFKNKNTKFKLTQKLRRLEKSLCKNIVFGGKENLRKISFLSNNKIKNQKEILEWKNKYVQQRVLPINLIGSSNDSGCNRYFNFNFQNKEIIYKPNRDTKIKIQYHNSEKQNEILEKLQEKVKTIPQPISIKLSTKFVWISFDEEKLNNYEFNEKDYKLERNSVLENITNKEERNFIAKKIKQKWHKEQEQRKLENKISTRYASVDLNPQYIGLAILEDEKIIKKICFDLTKLSAKLNLKSEDKKQKRQNNKRKYELTIVWKEIFKLCKHYKVANFVLEDLEFKQKGINENSNESNRKTKNIWHRTLTTNLISKYCNQQGINKIEVNPCYSSFIGNIIYKDYDPVNSSLEINRRGKEKYKTGGFYPIITKENISTMISLFKEQGGDVLELRDCKSWAEYYKIFTSKKIKYRGDIGKPIFVRQNSIKVVF